MKLIHLLTALVLVTSLNLLQSTRDRQTAEQQRDEAFQLADKAQEKALYWFDVHARTVAHYNRKSRNPNEQ